MAQYTSGGSIHPVLLRWEYPLRWNIQTLGGSIRPDGTVYFRREYPPSTLQLGVSTQYSSAGSIRPVLLSWEYPPSTPQLGVSDGTYKLQVGVSTSTLQLGVSTQYSSAGSIHPVLLSWEYPPSTPQFGVSIQMGHLNFRWEYPLRWNIYTLDMSILPAGTHILQVGVSIQKEHTQYTLQVVVSTWMELIYFIWEYPLRRYI
jgi:hypothetical protein